MKNRLSIRLTLLKYERKPYGAKKGLNKPTSLIKNKKKILKTFQKLRKILKCCFEAVNDLRSPKKAIHHSYAMC